MMPLTSPWAYAHADYSGDLPLHHATGEEDSCMNPRWPEGGYAWPQTEKIARETEEMS